MRTASILFIIIVSLAVPAFADDQADLKKATDQFDATYLEGFNKRDAAVMATHFTTNAVAVVPFGLQTDVRKLFEGVLKAGYDHAEVQTDHFWSLGPNIAIGTGWSRYTGKNQSGSPIESSNFWTATYVKEDGNWKIRMLTGFPKAQLPATKATIEKLNDAFVSAFNKGDFAAVGAMYAEDATALPPGSSMINGRSNIQTFWTQAGQGISDVKLTTVDVKPLGPNSAREIGTFSLMTKGQQSQQVVGKYVVVWQKVGNDWKLATDIWNADK